MGTQEVNREANREANGTPFRLFMKALLKDVQAFEALLLDGKIESGVRRIGAEQEMFLVDRAWRPAPRSAEILADLDDARFTTELAQFNLELNLDPVKFAGDCLHRLEQQLNQKLAQVRQVAQAHDVDVVLIGVLPTLTLSDLGIKNMTDMPRYHALNQALTTLRGRAYEFRIRGTDELLINHDSVMPEACNTSFQVHFQVGAEEFARLYNIAQAATGPVLAAATNSPVLFGKRLWRETRIAVFEQACDTRSTSHQDRSPRVSFGRRWVRESALELFREDISRFRVLLSADIDEDPFEALAEGRPPELKALRLHNSTVYRWNRCCYGISDGRPHLRIENRALPSGPTVVDEIANAAFWFGLMSGVAAEYGDITQVMEFDEARTNFVNASQFGLGAHLTWVGGKALPARTLLTQQLLPLAREGLRSSGIDSADVDRYLGVIEERVATGRTGSQWIVQSVNSMRGLGTAFERMCAVTAAAAERQKSGAPVHEWQLARLEEAGGWRQHFVRVEQFMTTDVFTVHQEDLVDLVAQMMRWQRVDYVPVEDDDDRLVGLVSTRALLGAMEGDHAPYRGGPTPVRKIMHTDLVTVNSDTPTLEAIRLMGEHRVGCLPVVEGDKVVGLITERSFVHLAAHLLERALRK